MRARGFGLLPLLAACAAPVAVRLDGTTAIVTLHGAPFATVQAGAEPRPFVFPLLGPGGVQITRSFPMAEVAGEATDHPHHQSLWFAHGSVDGFDFWQGTAHKERIALATPPTAGVTAAGARVACSYRWLADDALVCTEDRELVFGGQDDARTIDVSVALRPAGKPLVFGDTKEGTFALRVHQALCVEGTGAAGHLTNSEGHRDGDVWGKRARWIDDAGVVDGRAVGIAIFDHPQNHGHPTWWHARTYGLLAANPFGVHDFEGAPRGTGALTVQPGGELRLRYRVLLHGAGWDRARLDAAWRAWSAEEPALTPPPPARAAT